MTNSLFFSLCNEITQEKLVKDINNLITKNIKSDTDAQSTVMVVTLQKISQVIEPELPKIE